MNSYEDRIVVFLDILGFQEIINRTSQSDGVDNSSEIENLVDVFKSMEFFARPGHEELNNGKKVTQFSDSLIISFPTTLNGGLWATLFDLRLVIINLINRNMLCRGAITVGKLYHDKYVFGPALIEAYKLESKVAYYPRVILSEKVVKIGKNSPYFIHTPDEEEDFIRAFLDKDEDTMYFIDYFNIGERTLDHPEDFSYYLWKLREVIVNGLKSDNWNIKVKYLWMAKKFNKTIDYIHSNIDFYTPDLREIYLQIDKIEIKQ